MILICSLIIIVFCHELGHLLAAKACKCGVKTFSVGFGKPFFVFKTKKTNYQIAPILLGGFCELKDELKYTRSKYSFTNKTYTQKVIISLAGIAVNCWMAVIAYGLYWVTYNEMFIVFGLYSMAIGLSNLLILPCLDGFYPILFLFEKRWGKKKTYRVWGSICKKWFFWLMALNILSLPYLGWLIWTGAIL